MTSKEYLCTEALIVSACRTPVGTAFKGTLARTTRLDLAHHVVEASVARSGVDPDAFDDVVLGEALYGGGDIARHAAVDRRASPRCRAWPTTATAPRAWPPCRRAAAIIRAGMDQVGHRRRRAVRSTVPVVQAPGPAPTTG